MKQVSLWARNHQWKARITMIIAWIILTALAIFIGTTLTGLNITLSSTTLLIIVATFFATVFYYPSRSQKTFHGSNTFYIRQKICDFLLAVCSFYMILYSANKPNTIFQESDNIYAASIEPSLAKDSSAKTYRSIKEFSISIKDADGKMLKWKERKKLLKQQVKAIKRSSDLSNGEQALLIVVSILVALGLFLLVASLACSLSCNGSGAAAVLVMLAGTGLIVFLLVLAIRGIQGKKKKRKEKIEAIPEK